MRVVAKFTKSDPIGVEELLRKNVNVAPKRSESRLLVPLVYVTVPTWKGMVGLLGTVAPVNVIVLAHGVGAIPAHPDGDG